MLPSTSVVDLGKPMFITETLVTRFHENEIRGKVKKEKKKGK